MASLKAKNTSLLRSPFIWVIACGLALRGYGAGTRLIINPDGVQYIYQARALYYHEWSHLLHCKLDFLSPFPFFIAGTFGIVRDWVLAALLVNVLFGTAALVPLYYLLRRFLDHTHSTITLLIYSVIPVLVARSGDALRDPIFWFFLNLGLLLYVRQWDPEAKRPRRRFDLVFSCCCFLLAMWARIEGAMFVGFSLLYLPFANRDHRVESVLCFLSPIALLGGLLIGGHLLVGVHGAQALRLDRIDHMLFQILSNYDSLRDALAGMAVTYPGNTGQFLRQAGEVLWGIPIWLILNTFLEGFFYPFAFIFVIGFVGIAQRIADDRRIWYFVCLACLAILLLYVHLLQTWMIFNRFIVILLFPGSIIMGFGVENTLGYLERRFAWRSSLAVGVIVAVIMAFGLGKNLKPRERDKRPYLDAAAVLAQRNAPDQLASVFAATTSRGYEWVYFYAHRDYPGPICSKPPIHAVPHSYEEFLAALDAAHVQYVIYEENRWPKRRLDLMASPYQRDFRVLGRWRHPDSEELILLERMHPS